MKMYLIIVEDFWSWIVIINLKKKTIILSLIVIH